jgi:hypothetical protein
MIDDIFDIKITRLERAVTFVRMEEERRPMDGY